MTVTQERPAGMQVAFFTNDSFGPGQRKGHWYSKADGTKAYRMDKVAVFRSGEFRDSIGEAKVFDGIHMDMLANNFSLLRDNGAFPDPPIRCNHPGLFSGGGLEEVIGYVDTLVAEEATSPVDGKAYKYLFASYDVLNEDAAKKIDSGLWKNRSAEIGFYETNEGMEFYPVLVGFAYVDIPAVEGLNGNFSKYASELPGVGETFVAVAEQEEDGLVADDKNKGGQSNHSGAPQTPAAPAAPAAVPAAPAASPTFEFSIGGNKSTDFAAVQAHIAGLESRNAELQQFENETRESARNAFVDGLVRDNKILAPQGDQFKNLVKTMSDEQYGLFTASYADAPGQPVLGPQATGETSFGQSEPVAGGNEEEREIQRAKNVYGRHVMMVGAEKAAETPSGKLLKSKGLI